MSSARYSSRPASPRKPSRFTRFPWWAWLLTGTVVFFLLQGLQTFFGAAPSVDATQPPPALGGLVNGLSIGVLLVSIVVAAIRLVLGDAPVERKIETRSLDDAPKASTPRMSWGQFELLAVEAFRRRGFQITERGSSGEDGSRNLELRRGRQRFVAHCKAWRNTEVGIGAVRELYSMVVVTKAQGGIAITSGSFSLEARTFAAGRQLQLIDGQTLREMLRDDDPLSVMPTIMPTIIPTGIIGVPTAPR
jgi:restriction system protein